MFRRKSQLAIEYSYRVRSESPDKWVFWVHASNAARFEQSFHDIAEQVKIPNRQDSKIDIFKLVEDWLRGDMRQRWILILDNVDDDDLFHMHPPIGDVTTKPLLQYLPTSLPGYIIVTSRSERIALKIVERRDLVEIQPMDKSEALELLLKKLESDDNEDSRKLVAELEFMPLAIVQAAGYIRSRAPRYSVSRYLAEFRKSDREATNLLKQEANTLYRDWKASNSVLVTWQMSFDCIRRKNPSAADLLSLMCFFDRQAIPEYLLRVQDTSNHYPLTELIDDSGDDEEAIEADVSDSFEDDIATLRDYSFISIVENGAIFSMHRLVQLTTRVWLKAHGNKTIWAERFVNNLNAEVPAGEFEDREKCQVLFPHVKLAMSERPGLLSLQSRRNWASLLFNSAWYTWDSGNIVNTIELLKKSRKERVRLLGAENECSLNSTAFLALAYTHGGQWEKAEKLHMQVMEISKTKLGKDDPSTLMSMDSLAVTLWQQGRYKEAERLQVQAMEMSKTKIGEHHPDTLMRIGSLAATFQRQGQYTEAERLQVQVMEISKTRLGKDHPGTLTSMGDLAVTFERQGRYAEAERLQALVMEMRKTKLGNDHPDTMKSMRDLASTFECQGQYTEAERLRVQVMEMSKVKLGKDHPSTLRSLASLAVTFERQGRYTEAERLQVLVIELNKAKFGEDHPSTLRSMGSLAFTYECQGRYNEAERLEVWVMENSKIKLGEDHPDTLNSMSDLSRTWKYLGQTSDAINLLQDCLTRRQRVIGTNHPDTVATSVTLWKWTSEKSNGSS